MISQSCLYHVLGINVSILWPNVKKNVVSVKDIVSLRDIVFGKESVSVKDIVFVSCKSCNNVVKWTPDTIIAPESLLVMG